MKIRLRDLKRMISEAVSARCNCENLDCPHGMGACQKPAGKHRALYVGPVCDECASSMSPENMLEDDHVCDEMCDHSMDEKGPPGREKQVKKLKKKLPKTYVDSSGKRRKSNAFAVAWGSYNKSHE